MSAAETFDGDCCPGLVKTEGRVKALEDRADTFDAFMLEMREAMTYRLPLWATLLISGLSAAVAWFAK